MRVRIDHREIAKRSLHDGGSLASGCEKPCHVVDAVLPRLGDLREDSGQELELYPGRSDEPLPLRLPLGWRKFFFQTSTNTFPSCKVTGKVFKAFLLRTRFNN